MLETTTDTGMVQGLGGGRKMQQFREFIVSQKRLQEFPDLSVPDLGHELFKLVPHLFNVPGGLGHKVRQIDLRFFGTPQLLENDLAAAVETVDYSLNLDAVVLAEQLGDRQNDIPHLGLDRARLVRERERQVRLPVPLQS